MGSMTKDHPNNILGDLLGCLKENSSLILLDLSHNMFNFSNIDHQQLESFSQNFNLKFLMLNYNQLIHNDNSAESFTVFLNLLPMSLSHFNLSCTGIDDSNIGDIYLASLKKSNLKFLNLSENSLGRESCNTLSLLLRNNSYLRNLDLTDTRISESGIRLITENIGENKTLRSLKLSRNRIGSSIVELVNSCITHNSNLRIIDLRYNAISNDVIEQINQLIGNTPLSVLFGT